MRVYARANEGKTQRQMETERERRGSDRKRYRKWSDDGKAVVADARRRSYYGQQMVIKGGLDA